MITDPLAVLVVLAAIVWLSLWLEDRFRFLRSLGAALMGILFGMALSNSGVLAGSSSMYDFLQDTGVSLGIVLILSSIDLRTIVSAGPSMLAAFGLGAAGTAVGALVSALVLAPAIGEETWKLSGQFTGTYVGGGMNFAALGQALGTTSDLFTAAMAADVILTAVWMAICLLVPVVLGHGITAGEAPRGSDEEPETLERQLNTSIQAIPIGNAAALVLVALGAVWLSGLLGRAMPVLPEVLWLTTLALVMGQIRWVKRLAGGAMIGNYLVLLFLASNGAQSVVANIVRVGPSVFYFACLTVAVHGLIIFGVGRLLGFDFGTLAIASQANVGGAASAMAMASARGYLDRLLPGVAVGLLGYAVGNYLGFGVAALVRNLM
jgi:uncharacterized membrane protein